MFLKINLNWALDNTGNLKVYKMGKWACTVKYTISANISNIDQNG